MGGALSNAITRLKNDAVENPPPLLHVPRQGQKNKHITAKVCLRKREKRLYHPVGIEYPNPQHAVLLQEQLDGSCLGKKRLALPEIYGAITTP